MSSLHAQSKIGLKLPAYKAIPAPTFNMTHFSFEKKPFVLDKSFYLDPSRPAAFNSPLVDDVLSVIAVVNNFNHNTMPFFCKIEYQMEQAARFPVKFRLGDVQYVDMLEGKTDYIVPVW